MYTIAENSAPVYAELSLGWTNAFGFAAKFQSVLYIAEGVLSCDRS